MIVKPKRILWPTDFSALSLHGARYARGFCEMFGAELHVLHVVSPLLTPDFSLTLPAEVPSQVAEEEVVQACRAHLAELVAAEFANIPNVVHNALFGNSWSSICKYAAQAEIDLLIVSTHGRTGLRHVLIGSTAERIVQHSPCPVLVVKSPEKDFVEE